MSETVAEGASTMRFLPVALSALLTAAASPAAVAADRLTAEGVALPAAVLPPGAPFERRVDASGDTVLSVHVVLRPASSNLALARDRDGFWAPWDGDADSLPVAAARVEGDTLVYKLFVAPPTGFMAPYTITLSYRTPEGMKLGWFQAHPQEAAR